VHCMQCDGLTLVNTMMRDMLHSAAHDDGIQIGHGTSPGFGTPVVGGLAAAGVVGGVKSTQPTPIQATPVVGGADAAGVLRGGGVALVGRQRQPLYLRRLLQQLVQLYTKLHTNLKLEDIASTITK
jgi:hypothetical protein